MDQQLLLSFADLEERHWWFQARREIVDDAIGQLVTGTRARVVDVGCGTGGFVEHLAREHPEWVVGGVELSEAAAAHARSLGRDVNLGAFPRLPLEPDSVDLLTALDVLEHCEDEGAACDEIRRVLRPGGVTLLTVPALPSLWSVHDEDNHHYRRYTADTVRNLLLRAGLRIERVTYFNSLLLPAAYVSRALATLAGSRAPLGVSTPAPPINGALRAVFRLERPFLRRHDLPLGMSLLAIARKEASGPR